MKCLSRDFFSAVSSTGMEDTTPRVGEANGTASLAARAGTKAVAGAPSIRITRSAAHEPKCSLWLRILLTSRVAHEPAADPGILYLGANNSVRTCSGYEYIAISLAIW